MGGDLSKEEQYRPNDEVQNVGTVQVLRLPRVAGSKVNIFKQDPSVDMVGTRMKWLPEEILPGPGTVDVMIHGLSVSVKPDKENNYLFNPDFTPEEFDAIQSLTVTTNVLRMYRQVNDSLGAAPLRWQWGFQPLQVYPRMGEAINAYYSRDKKSLCFYYFTSQRSGRNVYTCRSFDIVAHETGHAILDGIKPEWNFSVNPYTMALHESFGDLTAIFAILDDFEMCEAVIAHSKGDLHNRSFLDAIAEEFGTAIGMSIGLRNADVDFTLDQVSTESHDLSQVFTSAVYDVLAEAYSLNESPVKVNPAMTLYTVGKSLLATFFNAILKSPAEDATFYDIATLMMKVEQNRGIREIMKKEFGRRNILDRKLVNIHNISTYKLNHGKVCGYEAVARKMQQNGAVHS